MSAVMADMRQPSPWRLALPAFLLVLAALLLLYQDTAMAMVTIWSRSDTFAHAFLVPPIVLWMVWRQRAELAELAPRPAPWAVLALVAVAAAWLVGDLASVNALTQLMFTAMLVLTVPAVLGLAVARALLFPLGFLFFMVPLGEFMLPVLMEKTANFTVVALRLSGVPVYREGLKFVIPTGNWSVVEACSGVRYLIASFMVGTLFAYLNYSSTRRRVIFGVISLLVPVVANWLRAYFIVMLGHLSNNRLAVGVDHLIYGWVFFGVVILLMFFIGARWSEPPGAPAAPTPAQRAAATQPLGASLWLVAALAVAAIGWPVLASRALDAGATGQPVSMSLPAALPGGWASATDDTGFKPRFVGAAAETGASYSQGRQTVGVYLAYYREQRPGRKLVSSENVLVLANDHRWNQVDAGPYTITANGATLDTRSAEILDSGITTSADRKRLEVRQLYWVGGRFTASAPWASILAMISRLQGQGDDAASIVIHTAGEDRTQTGPLLDAFTQQQLPTLEALLVATRAQVSKP